MPALVLWCRVPSLLSALLLCVWCVACKYASISRFKGVFSAFWGACVGLCGFGALRGLCGFCARVELGGFGACGVFAPILSVFHLLLSSFLPFCSCVCFLLCSLFFFVLLPCLSFLGLSLLFSFPFRTIRKKKGRKVFFLRPRFVCCVFLLCVVYIIYF